MFRELGGDGPGTHVACGYFGCEARPFNPILGALPGMFSVHFEEGDGARLRELFRLGLMESQASREGSETILSRLSELMLMYALPKHIDNLPEESTGWLAGLRDPQVAAALRLMHGYPARSWTLDKLASEMGMSRSSFADQFARFMGMPAMQYLAHWRLQLAANLFDVPGNSIERVAEKVGYESPAAFNRAFKRHVGMPPGAWRRQRHAKALSSTHFS